MRKVRARALPLLLGLACATLVHAASHREAPFIAQDPAADNTDVYAFVSYDAANLARAANDRMVTFIMNVGPGQDPGDGPTISTSAIRSVIGQHRQQRRRQGRR